MEWEKMDDDHERAKVFGGWIVKNVESVFHVDNVGDAKSGWDWRIALVFVPDPNHEWDLTPNKKEKTLMARPDCFELGMDVMGDPEESEIRKYIEGVEEENKKLKFMIDNGLGWEDMHNDIARRP